ncbi:MAG: ADP-glyceromanno-heptose 6-epimerase [Syntrophales bacterium]|jgi:ADP-L-glycero-D-manno-heptose 6-epimerase|nr:ADP-glyceromanno-heptose 6-epimerase [Syntrophales bacterium]MCK9527169.1 ADP-glyceromanno-heptose 6-epimerase [Syntrophales bacterium]MDX9921706.1 ADP-glyceromanno-heptose 6-epimerase [Syntrophales bacterium]
MIVVTGGAGFIGSALVWKLNGEGLRDILIVDNLGESEKWKNLVNLRFEEYIHKSRFLEMIKRDRIDADVSAVVHLGACSSTVERDADYLMENNYRYSRVVAEWALRKKARFIYASSAATYGDGSLGFSDADDVSCRLRPINMYGYSKQLFDLWVLRKGLNTRMTGIKFFNVFGPNEYHKADMRSVVHKAVEQVRDTGAVRLFKSHREGYGDGEQLRDFIYVKDCVQVLRWFIKRPEAVGIFNLGTGLARSWNDLAQAVFKALKTTPRIDYIDMPLSLRDQYQYYTEAVIDKLRDVGYEAPFSSLEDAVADYVVNYLERGERCLE